MPPLVRISDIGLYLRCPRLVYFEAFGGLDRSPSPSHLLLRGLMLSLAGQAGLEEELKAGLERLVRELPLIYGDMDPAALRLAFEEVEALIPGISEGFAPSLDEILPCEVDVDLRSERLGLSGRLDRLVLKGPIPSLIRTGSAPEEGVWRRERIQLAGYALLLDERCSIRIERGLVEYPRSGALRAVQIRSIDRARALRIRDRVQDIKDGRLPDRPEGARCDVCKVQESCEARYSLASKFF